jgi:flagellar hook assembly protein FlgD
MYTLPKTSSVKIVIYDMLGSKVRTLFSGSQDAGYKNILWNATNDQGDPVSAGMYIYTIEAERFFASKKMILLK